MSFNQSTIWHLTTTTNWVNTTVWAISFCEMNGGLFSGLIWLYLIFAHNLCRTPWNWISYLLFLLTISTKFEYQPDWNSPFQIIKYVYLWMLMKTKEEKKNTSYKFASLNPLWMFIKLRKNGLLMKSMSKRALWRWNRIWSSKLT